MNVIRAINWNTAGTIAFMAIAVICAVLAYFLPEVVRAVWR